MVRLELSGEANSIFAIALPSTPFPANFLSATRI